jgi:hypothetical protein
LTKSAQNAPKQHHYVPQFYLRRFASADDRNKVRTVERHSDMLVADRKSIGSIGYEEGLHDFEVNGAKGSIERDLNDTIETPFSNSRTWSKIEHADWAALDEADGFSIYGFARHLQRRNLNMRRFIENEHARFLAGEIVCLTVDERAMHEWIAAAPGRAHEFFREAALDTAMPDDAHAINVMICRSPIPFRTSTNPNLIVSQPGVESMFGQMFNSLRTWWLTLDRHCGAFIIAGGPPGFSNQSVPPEIARVVNRGVLIQLLHGDARYMLADDAFVKVDLEWAGFAFSQKTTCGFRYRAVSWKDRRSGKPA